MNTPIFTLGKFYKNILSALLLFALAACSDSDEPAAEQLPPTISGYEPTGQFTGQQITINGTNFGTSVEDVEVTFYDGEVAVVNTVTATALTVTVPSNAYVGPVNVKVKELEVEGSDFEVLTICNIFVGIGLPLQPTPCPRVKPSQGL
ncbi:MAG: IPT/TIG domain-containing protein [Cyclobacteriaceae bacterium]|jgi:hypothetical protein|nr:IPT/TIG domain-containing protein [Flammeovirgaceae bacterium]MCZ8022061.1 IPT/TIG domain-containing protein [Cytophagales bacterium]MCZ8328719.1 IPT/TIG domain-containing protein [Cyclobacteriaceae bacterium]MCZ8355022.1 IPT/TIG domain-containing protein [Cyclobacteriaceae bacterium]